MSNAWYDADCGSFLREETRHVIGTLANAAAIQSCVVEPEQRDEWEASVDILKDSISEPATERIEILRNVLGAPELGDISDVILEYDFRRRGLRMDCVLLAPGAIIVIEFKRSSFSSGDRDQVLNYCVNLVEFHEVTQALVKDGGAVVIPILVSTSNKATQEKLAQDFHASPWEAVLNSPFECNASSLEKALTAALELRKSGLKSTSRLAWLNSRFQPSSSILDAAISLWGQHDVSAIAEHAAPTEKIEASTKEIAKAVERARENSQNTAIFLSGAPGAGKTLVGLNLLFKVEGSVFVTGNTPLVDVLQEAIKRSYKSQSGGGGLKIPSGYRKEQLKGVINLSTFNIEKAHRFLKSRGGSTASATETVVIFDEAQRTYRKGKSVANIPLEKDEAQLIIETLEANHPGKPLVVVCLIGHNQAINKGESGIGAWFDAAAKCEWNVVVSDDTLALPNLFPSDEILSKWKSYGLKQSMDHGHLSHSLRFVRNHGIEEWASDVMAGDHDLASVKAAKLATDGIQILMTRSIEEAKGWTRSQRVGEERAGIIASAHARRLIAEGVYIIPRESSNIAHWMLAPSGDIRSSNMLEYAQSQFQIQGLELDYTIMGWDADLRREDGNWKPYKISGAGWQAQNKTDQDGINQELEYRLNSYRVLLTRARKGMVLFVPLGDQSGEDPTRDPAFYDGIYDFLLSCGATELM